MIIVSIPALYGRLGAILSALIIVLCAIGLTMHKNVYAGKPRPDFYYYYTNLSNLIVLLYFALGAPLLYSDRSLHAAIPAAEYCVAMAITLTNLVFHFKIFPVVWPQLRRAKRTSQLKILATDNLIIHYIVPWLVFLYWLLCAPGKHTIPLYTALLWTLLPIVYLCAVLLRAQRHRNLSETDSPYPYPFLDAAQLGAKRVALNCFRLYVLCAALSLGLLLLIRFLFSCFGGNHALLLI